MDVNHHPAHENVTRIHGVCSKGVPKLILISYYFAVGP